MELAQAQKLKEKIRSRKPAFGAWTSLSHPQITEIFSRAPFDFVGIDIEHSTISLEQSGRIIAAAQSNGVCCLPRIASHNMESIKRLLDTGADGLIVPMVNTYEEAQNLVAWSKYPPLGKRNFGVARAQGYGFDFDKYIREWNESSTLIIQIESIEAVQNIEKMLSLENVDGAMVGPYDISGSLGVPGQLEHPKVREACEVVVQACKKFQKGCGTHLVEPDQKSIDDKLAQGFTFITLASDIFILWKWAERMGKLLSKNV